MAKDGIIAHCICLMNKLIQSSCIVIEKTASKKESSNWFGKKR